MILSTINYTPTLPSEYKYSTLGLPQGRKPAGTTAALAAGVTAIMFIAFRWKIYEKKIVTWRSKTLG